MIALADDGWVPAAGQVALILANIGVIAVGSANVMEWGKKSD